MLKIKYVKIRPRIAKTTPNNKLYHLNTKYHCTVKFLKARLDIPSPYIYVYLLFTHKAQAQANQPKQKVALSNVKSSKMTL